MNLFISQSMGLIATSLVLLSSQASAREPQNVFPPLCRLDGGTVAGPFVKRSETAIQIFNAIQYEISPKSVTDPDNTAHAEDKNSYWLVYQARIVKNGNDSPPIMIAAGLSIEINKCSGAIRAVKYIR